ncbi:MAG TPA: YetF domain-containing protein [Candidatus Limnocylindrales bacterium]|nr:YetF domain-containing protein [Candidatus Limnocylindrales bacterium]
MPEINAPFDLPSDLLGVAIRVAVVYLFLLVVLRVAGKKEIGQLTLFEFIVILVIADAVQNSMVGSNQTIWGGLVAVVVLLALDKAFSGLQERFPAFSRFVEGEPTLLVRDGEVLRQSLRREGITVDELEQALRSHGLAELGQVRLAVLETDGTISVVPRVGEESRTKERLLRRRRPRSLRDRI